MKKQNTKGLIILVCILCVLVLALGGFIIYDKLLSKDENSNNSNIKVSIEKSQENGYYNQLVINDKKIQKEYETLNSIIFLDDTHIIADYKDSFDGFSRYYVFDKDGNILYNISELSSLTNAKIVSISYTENELHIETVTMLAGDNYRSLCYNNPSDIYYKFEIIKYLGNGKFGASETLSSLTVKDYLQNNYNYTCD